MKSAMRSKETNAKANSSKLFRKQKRLDEGNPSVQSKRLRSPLRLWSRTLSKNSRKVSSPKPKLGKSLKTKKLNRSGRSWLRSGKKNLSFKSSRQKFTIDDIVDVDESSYPENAPLAIESDGEEDDTQLKKRNCNRSSSNRPDEPSIKHQDSHLLSEAQSTGTILDEFDISTDGEESEREFNFNTSFLLKESNKTDLPNTENIAGKDTEDHDI